VNNKGILFKTWDTDDLQLYDNTILALNHLYILSGMYCLLILCREEIIKGAEGPTQYQDPQKKGQKDSMTK
jgi:hypothetical protein